MLGSYDYILVDGNYMARRMFAVHKELSTLVDGVRYYTGLTHGFLTQLCSVQKQYGGKVIVIWDSGIKRRRAIDKSYKAKRQEEKKEWKDRELFLEHIKVAKWVLNVAKVRQASVSGEEGDDVLFTLSRRLQGTKLIVSNDHDMYQAIEEDTHLMVRTKGEDDILSPRKFTKRMGVSPREYGFSMCLSGCSGDEVEGVQGVGETTALAIIKRWPMFVDVMLGYGSRDGYSLADWLPEVNSKNVVTKATRFFKAGDKGPDKRMLKVMESGLIIQHTEKLVKLYDVWPVKIRMGKQDTDKIEGILETLALHELGTKLDEIEGLAW